MTEPKPRLLPRDPAFRADQARSALVLSQFRNLSARLADEIAGLDVEALEWQPAPGRNTIGMLLAHNALVEVFWTSVASKGVTDHESAEAFCREFTGMSLDDDGMPAPPDGGHPSALAGWDLARYRGLLDKARQLLRGELLAMTDADHARIVHYRGRECSVEWIWFHLLEHFAAHQGQIGLVRALHASRR